MVQPRTVHQVLVKYPYVSTFASCISYKLTITPAVALAWATADAEIKVPFPENPALSKVFSLKTRVRETIASYGSPTASSYACFMSAFPVLTTPYQSIIFSPKIKSHKNNNR